MTIKRDRESGNMIARCDQCNDIVEFEDAEDWLDVLKAITDDGWQSKRGKTGWDHICVDCVAK